MADPTLKQVLEAALKATLTVAEVSPWVKAPAAFIAELSPKLKRLPDEERDVLAKATSEQLHEAFDQLDMATRNAAYAASGVDRIEDTVGRLQSFLELLQGVLQDSLGRIEATTADTAWDVKAVKEVTSKTASDVRRLLRRHERRRVPHDFPIFMAEALRPDFVPRPREYDQLIVKLLHEDRQSPTAITAALRGAGGYGKTILARALCHDERVRKAFSDGILWVTLGERPNVLAGLTTLYAALTGERPGFANNEDAGVALADLLGDGSYLLVIDDVWNPAHLTDSAVQAAHLDDLNALPYQLPLE